MLISVLAGFFVELITLFGIVLIHELGHVVAAKGFGWKIREIRLLPFGGVAVTDEAASIPAREEIIVALAGPLQNALMIAFGFAMKALGVSDAAWWDYFMTANTLIGLFNLLPIQPLDGGRLMQAALSYWMTYHQVMVSVTIVSMALSVMMLVAAVSPWHGAGIQLNLLIIGGFLLVSNWHDYRSIPFRHMRFLMSRQRRFLQWVMRGTLAQPIVVHGQRKIAEVVRMFMRERYHLIYVLNEQGAIRGVFPEQRMIDAYFHEKRPESAVSELFRR